eukprot:CAMPEP_0172867050 /NCGR_PEP_ID=MMETSP1075-20121228/82458_1 /TAXON_ID=2916 /ORGANISM="Ceratium fusus, Strain PA161109" /LENGTH=34 /DNA_ID= /DNA_START= /DNA_END= /DNA_ORIENTATION=
MSDERCMGSLRRAWLGSMYSSVPHWYATSHAVPV